MNKTQVTVPKPRVRPHFCDAWWYTHGSIRSGWTCENIGFGKTAKEAYDYWRKELDKRAIFHNIEFIYAEQS